MPSLGLCLSGAQATQAKAKDTWPTHEPSCAALFRYATLCCGLLCQAMLSSATLKSVSSNKISREGPGSHKIRTLALCTLRGKLHTWGVSDCHFESMKTEMVAFPC